MVGFRSLRTSALPLFCALYGVLAAALLLQRGVTGTLSIAVGAGFILFSCRNPYIAARVLFFLMPAVGFIDNLSLKAQSVPVLLGPFSGWALGAALSSKNPGRGFESNRIRGLVMMGICIVLFMALVAAGRYLRMVWPDLDQAVAPPVIDYFFEEISAKNAVGWVVRGSLIYTGGWILAVLLLGLDRNDDASFWGLLSAALFGIIPAFVLGGYQVLGHEAFLNTRVFAEQLRVNGTFADPNALGMFLSILIPIVMALLVKAWTSGRKTVWPAFFLSHLIGDFFLLAGSGTRSAMLSSGIGIFVLFFFLRTSKESERRLVAPISLATLLLVGGIVLAVSSYLPMVQRSIYYLKEFKAQGGLKASLQSPSSRWQMWRRSFQLVRQRPLLGSGPGTFLIETRRLDQLKRLATPNDSAGNFYLDIWAEMGVLGLGCLSILLFQTLKDGWTRCRRDGSVLDQTALAGLAGMCAALFFGSHLMRFELALLFWTLAAVLWRERRP